MDEYKWWGRDGEPPPNLKTKKQLAELGLAPLKAVGIIRAQKYDLLLYDPENPESCRPKRKPTDKQLETLAANREKARIKREYNDWHNSRDRIIEQDRVRAVKWARDELSKDDWVILDTETTGLHNAEIVEIAIVSHTGETLLNTLIKPSISIPADVVAIHGIGDEMVADAPSFPEVYSQIVQALEGKRCFIYNAAFDIQILDYCRRLHNLESFHLSRRYECVMTWHAQWAGDWSYYHESYRWHPLDGGHRALGDCLAALERIKRIAADSDTFHCPVPRPE
ncbi:3'-5' exonuclease [Microcoleus sp. D3_18a_C4]|uniref:3'-5' exonuclease n=1 Tax=Microcoleus sp. D3_18a_C4 TaxID=3055332 RepID=UPI002FD18C24